MEITLNKTINRVFPLSLRAIWRLFLLTAFPIHVWALLISLRDIVAVIELTNVWDGIGATAYALLIALVESVTLTLFFALISLLLPRSWQEDQKVLILGSMAITTTFWGILNQVNFYLFSPPQKFLSEGAVHILLERSGRPVFFGGIFLLVLLLVVLASVITPIIAIRRSQKIYSTLKSWVVPIYTLCTLYIVIDLVGLVIILVRNI